ncbi:hypothetical protein D9Q98_006068 [Chlorella vulgaris]|uniref:RWD domain-containing protein n=1 Tax=Chlorella vulgaris TaxID=3077 RepID=A0A9D4Z1I9_CHLVU|nr:hypothetical protein D9Q98_006068 [Chlorella vulgaris]
MSGQDSNRQQQADELCALQAIYGEDAVQLLDTGSLRFAIPDAASAPHLQLTVHLPESYPAEHPPVLQLSDSCNCLSEDVLSGLARDLESSFKAGEVVLWQWIEHLREQWPTIDPQQLTSDATAAVVEAAAAGTDSLLAAELQVAELEDRGSGGDQQQKQQQQQQATRTGQDDELQAALAEVVAAVVHGEPFTEKRSTFQAHLAPATSLVHVEALMELLLQNNKIRGATHNIMAYRIEQSERSTFLQDSDDDGEQAAGSRLLHLLQVTDSRNVCVVVSRWFGGIHLGPARFTHINNAARELLDACGYIAARDNANRGSSGKGKKR